jgi:hypothetical protein
MRPFAALESQISSLRDTLRDSNPFQFGYISVLNGAEGGGNPVVLKARLLHLPAARLAAAPDCTG